MPRGCRTHALEPCSPGCASAGSLRPARCSRRHGRHSSAVWGTPGSGTALARGRSLPSPRCGLDRAQERGVCGGVAGTGRLPGFLCGAGALMTLLCTQHCSAHGTALHTALLGPRWRPSPGPRPWDSAPTACGLPQGPDHRWGALALSPGQNSRAPTGHHHHRACSRRSRQGHPAPGGIVTVPSAGSQTEEPT